MGLPTITIMGYQALVFCADEKTVRLVTQILSDLEFSVEACTEPFDAVKRLTAQHFDALVVDCDHEQNAALLFKTARNSEMSNAALSVAVVQGQGGIAKAFRIGANLVLTKPLNVEQSKGTLRVARGLLRKAEADKSAARGSGESHSLETTIAAAKSDALSPAEESEVVSPPPSPKPLVPATAMLAARLEAESEPTPRPDPAEAALLESMPPPVLAKSAGSDDSSTLAKASSLEPGSKTEPTVLAEATAEKSSATADAATPATPVPPAGVPQIGLGGADAKDDFRKDASKKDASSSQAATATAPAKELPQPVANLFGTKATATTPTAPKKSEVKPSPPIAKTKKGSSQVAAKKGPAGFSWSDAARDQASGGADSKRNFFIAAVLVLGLAAAGYYAWPRLEPVVMSLPIAQKYLGSPAPSAPTPAVSSASSAAPSTGEGANATRTQPAAPASEGKKITDEAQSSNSPSAMSSAKDAGAAPPDVGTAATPQIAGTNRGPGAAVASAPETAKPVPLPQRVPESVSQGLLIKRTQPVYPSLAKQKRIAGNVELQANIGRDGTVTDVKALSGDETLAGAAIDAVRQWKYKPYVSNGQPVEIETQITVKFMLP
jgi:protein TonB